MGKKKKKNQRKNQPTTIPFWSKITTPQNTQNLVNVSAAKSKTDNANFEQPEAVELTKETTKADNESQFWDDNVLDDEQGFSNNLSEITKDGQAAPNLRIQKEQTKIQMKLIETGPNNSQKNSGNIITKQDVVRGLASDIKLVVNNSSKAVATPNLNRGPITYNEKHGAKPIQLRITRVSNDGINTMEEMKNLAYLAKQTQETISGSQEVKSQAQEPQVKQTPILSPWKDLPPQLQPLYLSTGYPKGIPRSFYANPNSQTPEPYSLFANKNMNLYPANVQPNTSHGNWQPQMETDPVWIPNSLSANPGFVNMANVGGNHGVDQPMFQEPFDDVENRQVYSPSDAYADNNLTSNNDIYNDLEPDSPEQNSGQKRQSAFDRLGPVSQPKKPKLTINLLFNKEQAVREVVDGALEESKVDKYIPVHLRENILSSTDETIVKFRDQWPWRKSVPTVKSVTARHSKMVMILEMEQMEEYYVKENLFFVIAVKGYPPTWTKENVLDTLLDAVKAKGFIPCFIEFTPEECKFLVVKNRPGILVIHKHGFHIRKGEVEMVITISATTITLNHIEFIPRLILRRRLVLAYDGVERLDLNRFTIKEDISNFIYYPLNQQLNQIELMELQTNVNWENITELNLSHNRLTSIDGFNLAVTTPRLKHLDLTHNYLDNVMKLLHIRDLGLRSIKLEGNPLCINYIDPDQYIKVLKTIFSSLQEIDDVPIILKGDMPRFKRNYCPEEAKPIVDKFLRVYFPLLDSTDIESRAGIEALYHDRASLTITYRFKIRYGPIYRTFRSLFQRSRVIDEGDTESVDGASVIADLIDKWPPLKHDPATFTVDVIKHDDYMTIFKVAGIVKLTSESLAVEEHMLAFTRTFVLHSYNGYEYKITNDMLYWDIPTPEYSNNAFKITQIKPLKLNLELESEPDKDLKESLTIIFMQLTDLSKEASERCLELKNWNLRSALDYFIALLKLGDLETLTKEEIS